MARGDLTDEPWAVLKALLPKGMKAGRPPVRPRRQLIAGIRFRVRTGVPWRDVPVGYGPAGRISDLFRRWQRDGTWHRVLTQLQSRADAEGAITWDRNVDSTVCRAHQHAAGARKQGDLQKEPPGGVFTEPCDHGLGRSRGGFTTKLHLAVEQGQKPMSIVVTAGQRGDCRSSNPCWASPYAPSRAGPAAHPPRSSTRGQAYSNGPCREYLRRRGMRHTIPEKADSQAARLHKGSRGGRPPGFEEDRYKKRNTVERAINKLKQSRAVATRYDKRGHVFLGTVTVATAIIWLRS
ncbi:IS5 family transposase [Streptomyces glomeratus]|uniref:IS5 family transposase n=1 Tax=Streptomyces glomeratus TaxID=284452 RepID=UPI001F24BC26|nr:IS5 family transposase [Streptomyces glomeratus]MCF1512412.1 IS5 family transposase [Streptomyces glomeratus]